MTEGLPPLDPRHLTLEDRSLATGFKIALLGVNVDRNTGVLEYCATLFDGGRAVRTVHRQTNCYTPSDIAIKDLRSVVAKVSGPPGILAAFGHGWIGLLNQVLPDYVVAEMQVLDLMKTAVALRPELPSRTTPDEVRRAYGVATAYDTDALDSPVYEAVLWALIAHAARLNMDWPQLLAAAEQAIHPRVLDRYAFGEVALALLPDAPGVYIMDDSHDTTLYVGKAASLARRLRDYFHATRELPPKLREIRERIHRFEYRLVGSELEALLIENKLITEMLPEINTQRAVAEGASRYGFPLFPFIVICPSTKKGAVELFFCGAHDRALQCRVKAAKPPRAKLEKLARAYAQDARPLRAPKGVVAWGLDGHEIACRYFGRARNTLHWLEINLKDGPGPFMDRLLPIVSLVATQAPEPGEFRIGEE